MPQPKILTFTTDFGTSDTYAGQMRGVVLSVVPEATLVDLSHDVPAHDVAAGAYVLQTGYSVFPMGTIHIAIVDPGVGTSRRGIAVRTERYIFIAPDNGILTRVLEEDPPREAYVLEASHYRRPSVSATFEGRDVFAPAAAWIARGVPISNLGPPAGEIVRLPVHRSPIESGVTVRARVLLVDRFGNVTLDLPRRYLEAALRDPGAVVRIHVSTPRGQVNAFCGTYAEAPGADPFLVWNSADHLEVAVRNGRAADKLGLAAGDDVEVVIAL
ncbi:MAG: SAM hydrolase/SAM-dependent halogenase family protein [Thermoplasmata archaeon]